MPAELPISDEPACGTNDVMILMAQAVPTATAVPCVQSMPAGWEASEVTVRRGRGRFSLLTDDHRVEVMLRPPGACSEVAGDEVPSDELDMRRFEQPTQLTAARCGSRRRTSSAGACVTYEFDLAEGADRRSSSSSNRRWRSSHAAHWSPRSTAAPASASAASARRRARVATP